MSNSKYFNGVDRLNAILSLYQAKRARYSISDISEMLKIPIGIVRDDIVALHTCREIPVTFYPCNETILDDFDNNMSDEIRQGVFDDEELEMLSSKEDDMFLALTALEYKCLKELQDDNENWTFGVHRNFVTKPLYNQAKANMQIKASEMQNVIEEQKSIRIRYFTKNKKTISIDIRPLQLVKIETEDLYYVVTIYNGAISPFRLDKIKGFDVLDIDLEMPDTKVLNDLPNIWGMELGERVHVRILIRNEGRVQEKVRRDLLNRTNGKWKKSGDDLLFEDDVIGIGSFKNWLNGYGSSILVLEPASLRNEIIDSAKRRLKMYEKVQ